MVLFYIFRPARVSYMMSLHKGEFIDVISQLGYWVIRWHRLKDETAVVTHFPTYGVILR